MFQQRKNHYFKNCYLKDKAQKINAQKNKSPLKSELLFLDHHSYKFKKGILLTYHP